MLISHGHAFCRDRRLPESQNGFLSPTFGEQFTRAMEPHNRNSGLASSRLSKGSVAETTVAEA
ncbi:hypothetical protein GCM10027405_03000 [Arthrobacter alkaliphilus]